MLAIALVVPVVGSRTAVHRVGGRGLKALGRGEGADVLVVKAAKGFASGVDAAEEEILVEVASLLLVEASASPEALDARLDAPGAMGSANSLTPSRGGGQRVYSSNGNSLESAVSTYTSPDARPVPGRTNLAYM